jgi:hypothetical protein
MHSLIFKRIVEHLNVREGRPHESTKKYHIPSFRLPTGDV